MHSDFSPFLRNAFSEFSPPRSKKDTSPQPREQPAASSRGISTYPDPATIFPWRERDFDCQGKLEIFYTHPDTSNLLLDCGCHSHVVKGSCCHALIDAGALVEEGGGGKLNIGALFESGSDVVVTLHTLTNQSIYDRELMWRRRRRGFICDQRISPC